VSSPGAERPLGKKEDFERFIGKIAKIKRVQPIEGQKNFTGVLMGATEDSVKLMIADKTVTIPFADIRSARLRPDPSEK
jgi:ribosome maturation factor RimP